MKKMPGIIGGSGFFDLAGPTDTRRAAVETRWGAPSDALFRQRPARPGAGGPAAPGLARGTA